MSALNNPWGSHGKFLEGRDHISVLIFNVQHRAGQVRDTGGTVVVDLMNDELG